MYVLDKITLGDESNPVYQSYEYSAKSTLLGLPTWAALVLLIAIPLITFLLFYSYTNNTNS